MTTHDLAVGDFTFRMDLTGPEDGDPVLMLHGFPQSRHTWRGQAAMLAQRGFRCVAPDQRGYSPGARPAGAEAYGLDNLVGDGLAIMDTLGAERFHLVGHDWGGHIAWTLAGRAPERIKSLTVLSRPHPAAFANAMKNDPDQPARSGHHKWLLEPGTAADLRQGDMARFRAMFKAQGVPDQAADRYVEVLSDPGALEAAIDWYRAAATTFRNAEAARIGAPTLYVWGDADTTVGRMAAEAVAAHIDGPYRFAVIPGAGHFLTDQVPDAVNRLLLAHLT
jgi:pimeloyl-ACP methyl ester carboxylesterase